MHLLAGFVSSSSLSLLEQCYIKIVCHACLSGFTRFARSNMIITSGKFLHGCTRSRFIIEHDASTGRCYVLMICKIRFDSAGVGDVGLVDLENNDAKSRSTYFWSSWLRLFFVEYIVESRVIFILSIELTVWPLKFVTRWRSLEFVWNCCICGTRRIPLETILRRSFCNTKFRAVTDCNVSVWKVNIREVGIFKLNTCDVNIWKVNGCKLKISKANACK